MFFLEFPVTGVALVTTVAGVRSMARELPCAAGMGGKKAIAIVIKTIFILYFHSS